MYDPSKSQLVLLSDRDLGLGDKFKVLGLDTLKECFKQLDPCDMIPLLQELTQVAKQSSKTPQNTTNFSTCK